MAHLLRTAARAARPLSSAAASARITPVRAFASRASRVAAPAAARALRLGAVATAAAGATLVFAVDEAHCSILDWFFPKKRTEWDDVRDELNAIFEDDGLLAPLLIRLAWHSSGTFCAADGTGGSNGATMRFAPESGHGANAGLDQARNLMEPIKERHPNLSYADLYTFAGAVGVEYCGGPKIPWRPGRSDAADGASCPEDGRLPDASQGATHIRCVFGRMGFSDREMVALIGAHTLGFCHADRSGYEGPWTFDPQGFDNSYYQLLLDEKWETNMRKPMQFADSKTKTLMMLPADLALVEDPKFREIVELYAKNSDVWFKDFAAAFGKLLDLGVRRE